MIFLRKTGNTGWFIGGTIIALLMILLAELSAPPRTEIATPYTNTIQKDFRPILKNIKTIPKNFVEEKTKYQTLLVKRLSGVPEPANGPMAVLSQMQEAHTPYLGQFDMSAVKAPTAWNTDWLLEIIRQDPSVKHAYKEQKMQSLSVWPNDEAFEKQTNLHDPISDVDIDAPEAWAYTTGNDSVVIAVLENNGLDINNPDLFPNLWVNSSEAEGLSDIDDDNNGCIDDIHGCNLWGSPPGNGRIDRNTRHGMRVSSILARGNNGYALTGVVWNTRIMYVQGSLVEGLQYVGDMRDRGVNVRAVNHSRATPEGCNPLHPTNRNLDHRNAIRMIGQKGILFVQGIANGDINYNSTTQETKQLARAASKPITWLLSRGRVKILELVG